jgi:hypothetical protein
MMRASRRLLVSPDGFAHLPNCHHVPITAETVGWGEIAVDRNLAALSAALADGHPLSSMHPRRLTPGPTARHACRICLAADGGPS